jgi:5-methylcytosine-specific restriction endonuclease McrA
MSGGPSEPPARIVRDSARWFTEGAELKTAARRARSCVECRKALPSRRTPYCSRACRWRFQGRYFWDAARTYVIHRDRFVCQLCRRRFRVAQLEVDHRLEIARGGPSLEYENLQTICRGCHRAKTVAFLRSRAAIRREGATTSARLASATAEPGWEAGWFPA